MLEFVCDSYGVSSSHGRSIYSLDGIVEVLEKGDAIFLDGPLMSKIVFDPSIEGFDLQKQTTEYPRLHDRSLHLKNGECYAVIRLAHSNMPLATVFKY